MEHTGSPVWKDTGSLAWKKQAEYPFSSPPHITHKVAAQETWRTSPIS